MNSTFALVFVGVIAAAVYGEVCMVKDECKDTTCVSGMVECVEISGNHLCTCVQQDMHNVACSTRTDCQMDSVQMNCDNTMRHCVDETCRCEGKGHNHGLFTHPPHPDHPSHPPHGGGHQ
ncbi:uncharacterized protein LOC110451123 [Mizuhopecten yessoensis]|uniref:EB domain-containing protein n=1 Tax=Mizuhopecten yessoensis TaxID=6573 RepID=A0A210QMB1_MIZYE|nr:uncharacterized protein LOC110451123 [Mizuhopecten yessoensis]OWF49876.1 hypothetical protein KP79_PYT13508 [Mizuhopecten yessoensis]